MKVKVLEYLILFFFILAIHRHLKTKKWAVIITKCFAQYGHLCILKCKKNEILALKSTILLWILQQYIKTHKMSLYSFFDYGSQYHVVGKVNILVITIFSAILWILPLVRRLGFLLVMSRLYSANFQALYLYRQFPEKKRHFTT